MRAMISAALLAATASGAAIAQDTPADPAGGKKVEASADKKICRRTRTTGSILAGKPICHTKAEWVQIDSASQQGVDQLRRAATNR